MPIRFTLVLLALFCAANLNAQPGDDNRISRVTENLEKEQQQARQALQRERKALQKVESAMGQRAVSANQLEQARLNAEALQSQRNSITSRLLSRRDSLRELRAEQERIAERLTNTSDAELAETLKKSSEELRAPREQLELIETSLVRLQRVLDDRLAIARQQLSVLQNRFELPELNAMTRPPSYREIQLREQIDQQLATASDFRLQASAAAEKLAAARDDNSASLLNTISPELTALNNEQRWLALQAQTSEDKAELLQLRLKRLRAEQIIRVLSSFPQTPSTPIRVLRNGRDNVEELQENLRQQHSNLRQRQAIISDQLKLEQSKPGDNNERSALLADIESQYDEQVNAMSTLLEQTETIAVSYQQAIAERGQAALLERNSWPGSRYAWQSLANNFANLPGRVVRDFSAAARKLGTAAQRMLQGENMVAVITALGLLVASVVGFVALRRWERSRPSNSEALEMGRSLREPLRILRRNYFLLLLPLLMGVMGWQLGLSVRSLTLLITPLLIWPTVTVSIAFTRYFLRTYTPDISREETTTLVRLASWVIAFTAVLAGCLVIARTVALSPLVTASIEGLSMICLLVIALPLIKLRRSLLSSKRELFTSGDFSAHANRRRRALSIGSGILVFALVASALVGLAGYTNLAWSIARYIGWLVMVALGWLMARSLLRDAIDSWHARIVQHDPNTGAFWRQCVLAPLYGVLVILLTLGAGALLYWLYGWNEQTPVMQTLPKIFNYTLFEVRDTKIKASNFFIAAFIVFMVFRAASWSREVSYRFALQKVQDIGIRNSLSTFVQYIVVVAGLMIAMRTIGLDLTALTVFAGAMGVGIGFGLQQIVVNFISGILLLIERPLRTSDLVNVDKYEGEVTHIGIRSLTVKTFDAQEVVIPNSAVITQPFTNWTRSDDVMRTVLMVGISYDDDPAEAIEIIHKVCTDHSAVLREPAPKVLLWEYADSALLIRVQLFSRIRGDIGRIDMRSQLLLGIRTALQDAGMSIPFPQRDVHLIKQPD